jgi:hypothetical protein
MKTARVIILVLEGVNVIAGITANIASLNNMWFLGLPAEWWNIICLAVVFVGFVAFALLSQRSENAIKQDVYAQVRQDIEEQLRAIKPQEGRLNNVSLQDRLLIQSFALQMIFTHGHQDLKGLLADRASGVPLNELMVRECQVCRMPRNQRSKE